MRGGVRGKEGGWRGGPGTMVFSFGSLLLSFYHFSLFCFFFFFSVCVCSLSLSIDLSSYAFFYFFFFLPMFIY